MKRLQLLLATLFLSSFTLLAQQSFSLIPNPVFGVDKDDYTNEGQAMVKNLSAETESFRWTRTIIRLDHDSICYVPVTDPYLHWFYAVSEKTFQLEPQQEGPLYVTLWDFEESGCCAIVNMKIEKLTGTPDSVDVFYYLRSCQPLAVSSLAQASIEVFPNPTAQYFSLKNAEMVHKLTLCDASGKMLRRIPANSDQRYEVGDLPAGAYFLVLENKEGAILQVLSMAKI